MTMPWFAGIISVLALVIAVFALLGMILFDPNSNEGQAYFPSYGTALWNMLMVLNGSNWPSPMMPAYQVCSVV